MKREALNSEIIMKANINQLIWNSLMSDAAIQKDISRKIINTRALAKYLIKKHTLNTSLDAVISAIRRFQTKEINYEEEKKLASIFKNSIVTTKNNIVCLTLTVSKDILQRINIIHNNPKLTVGEDEVILMIEHSKLEKAKEVLKRDIKKIEEVLSEISIRVSETAIQTKGVLAKIANELSLADINIRAVLICPPSFLIYINQKDIVKAHESTLKLTNNT